MSEMVSLPPQEILAPPPEHLSTELPPAESVPLLKEYGRLGLTKFMDRYAVPTQLDDRGFVDYGWLLGYIDSLVDEDYVWSSRLDIHHLQWEGSSYHPDNFTDYDDPSVPQRFREIPFHKLLIPRQMHDLIHLVTLPPKMPEYSEMKKRVEAFDVAVSLFQKAKQTLDIEQQNKRLIPAPHPKYRNKTFDPVKRKMIEREVLRDRYAEFAQIFHNQLSQTSQQDVEDLINMDAVRRDNPVLSIVSSLDRAVRLNKQKQAIRPKLRWQPPKQQKAA